jgi:CxxC motif-containing protein (DUF1111 family)
MHRWIAVLLLALTVGCETSAPEGAAAPGQPLPDLTPDERARFDAGLARFDRDFTEAEGLGPLFNQRRCSSCHDIPTLGGNGVEVVAKATRFEEPATCDLLEAQGGDMVQQHATAALEALGVRGEAVPTDATVVAALLPPQLYGLGLIEAIPDREILDGADPEDADGDGVRGRALILEDGRLGRFGRKLRFATVRDFIEDAIHEEMGLTTRTRPEETTINGRPMPPEADPAPDPEVSDSIIDLLSDYVHFLAAPEREVPPSSAAADSIAEGELLFGRIGCAECHTPRMRTGPSDVPALHQRTVALYSDLLLHDMGEDLATICGPGVTPSEWRTPPLFGLRHRTAVLHDGRAQAYGRVIDLHGGEAAASRGLFLRLSPEQQAFLLRFLASL